MHFIEQWEDCFVSICNRREEQLKTKANWEYHMATMHSCKECDFCKGDERAVFLTCKHLECNYNIKINSPESLVKHERQPHECDENVHAALEIGRTTAD